MRIFAINEETGTKQYLSYSGDAVTILELFALHYMSGEYAEADYRVISDNFVYLGHDTVDGQIIDYYLESGE